MSGLPPRHSFTESSQKDDFAFHGVEHRKPPLPISQHFSSAPEANMALLGTFRHRLPSNLPLRACAPLMVELFTPPAFFRGTRAWSSARLRLSPGGGSPQRRTLYGPLFGEFTDDCSPAWLLPAEMLHPFSTVWQGSEPRGRICGPLTAHLLWT